MKTARNVGNYNKLLMNVRSSRRNNLLWMCTVYKLYSTYLRCSNCHPMKKRKEKSQIQWNIHAYNSQVWTEQSWFCVWQINSFLLSLFYARIFIHVSSEKLKLLNINNVFNGFRILSIHILITNIPIGNDMIWCTFICILKRFIFIRIWIHIANFFNAIFRISSFQRLIYEQQR